MISAEKESVDILAQIENASGKAAADAALASSMMSSARTKVAVCESAGSSNAAKTNRNDESVGSPINVNGSGVSSTELTDAHEWIARQAQFVEAECRRVLASSEGQIVLADQARVRWARDNDQILEVTVSTGSPAVKDAVDGKSLGLDASMPHQLDLIYGDLHLRLSDPFLQVTSLAPDSPFVQLAEPRALRLGDAILSVNGKHFANVEEFVGLVREKDELKLEIMRHDEALMLDEYVVT